MKANGMDYDHKSRPNNTHIAVLVSYFNMEALYKYLVYLHPFEVGQNYTPEFSMLSTV